MKKIVLIAAIALAVFPAAAQKIARGDKAPDLQVKEWISSSQPSSGTAMMVEFFHSGNSTSMGRVGILDALARSGSGKIDVVVIAREDNGKVRSVLGHKGFHAAIDDDGKTFSAFSALYVPYAVIVDKRGRVAWMGNPSTLTTADIEQLIK